MGRHRAVATSGDRRALVGAALVGIAAPISLSLGALFTAGDAAASCASFSGFANSVNCSTQNLGDLAIVLGPKGTASASGGLNTAVVVNAGTATATTANQSTPGNLNIAVAFNGGGAKIDQGNGGLNLIVANGGQSEVVKGTGNIVAAGPMANAKANGLYNVSVAQGAAALAETQGNLNRAFVSGTSSSAIAAGGSTGLPMFPKNIGGNASLTIGNNSVAIAGPFPKPLPGKLQDNVKVAGALGSNKISVNQVK